MFNPQNWYWTVGGSTTQVYASARNVYVPLNDPDFVAWLDIGNEPSKIDVEANIWPYVSNVLPAWLFDGTSFAQPTSDTWSKKQLKNYAASVRFNKETGGFSYGGKSIVTTRESQGQITAAYNMAVRDNTYAPSWKAADGSFVTLNAATIIAMAIAVGNFVSSVFNIEGTVASEIDAGTIITLAEIDTAFA